jgi:hypothetical protein
MELKVKKKGHERGRFITKRMFAVKYDELLVPENERYNVFERSGRAIIGHENMLTQCRVCNELMTHDNFSVEGKIDKYGRTNLRTICLTCDTKNRTTINKLKKDPNTPPPGPNCDCCGLPFGDKKPTLDHNHKTGKFRGWVHNSCNAALGKLGDNVEGLQKALNYLKRTTPND